MAKKWYASKTVWVNLLSIVALIAQAETGFVMSPEACAYFFLFIVIAKSFI